MKIIIISPSLDPMRNISGISSIVNTIISHSQNDYIHYTFGSTDQDKGKRNIKWVVRLLQSFKQYRAFLKKNKPDLVHMNVPFDTNGILREYIISTITKRAKVKIFVHIHGGINLSQKPKSKIISILAKKILKNAEAVAVLSCIEKKSLETYYDYPNALILHNSIDASIYANKRSPLNNRTPKILFIGRIDKNKGLIEIIESMKLLSKEYSFNFIVCGDGPEKESFVTECQSILKDRFEYKGVVFGEEKREIIIQSDLYLLPSYFEGLPISLLETMAGGVVPLVTNVGSIPEIIQDGKNGLFIRKKDSNDLFLKLKYLLDNPQKISDISICAQNTIIEDFDVTKMIKKLNDIYNKHFSEQRITHN